MGSSTSTSSSSTTTSSSSSSSSLLSGSGVAGDEIEEAGDIADSLFDTHLNPSDNNNNNNSDNSNIVTSSLPTSTAAAVPLATTRNAGRIVNVSSTAKPLSISKFSSGSSSSPSSSSSLSSSSDDTTMSPVDKERSRLVSELMLPTLPLPSESHDLALTQILLASHPERIARKMDHQRKLTVIQQYRNMMNKGDDSLNPSSFMLIPRAKLKAEREERKVLQGKNTNPSTLTSIDEGLSLYDLDGAYEALEGGEPVFLHPDSAVAAQEPEYVTFTEMMRGCGKRKRTLISGLTIVQPEWMHKVCAPLCSFSKPLEDPMPVYESSYDQLMAYVNVTIGPFGWDLPLAKQVYGDEPTVEEIEQAKKKILHNEKETRKMRDVSQGLMSTSSSESSHLSSGTNSSGGAMLSLLSLSDQARELALADKQSALEEAGIQQWETRGRKPDVYYRHLARVLLEGSLIPSLRAFRPYLTGRSTALLQPALTIQAQQLVSALKEKGVVGRGELLLLWYGRKWDALEKAMVPTGSHGQSLSALSPAVLQSLKDVYGGVKGKQMCNKCDPTYLLNEFSQWVQPMQRQQVRQNWPPIK